MLVYLSIFLFAILEGEIYYITMCIAAAADPARAIRFSNGSPRWPLSSRCAGS